MCIKNVKMFKTRTFIFFLFLILLITLPTVKLEAGISDTADDIISIKISFAGDCTLGSDLSYGRGNSFMEAFEKQKEPYGYFFKNVTHVFENDDLTIVNLEGTLTNADTRNANQYCFKGMPEFANILKESGIELVNLANNHSMDYGERGYSDTIISLDKSGISSYDVNKPYTTEIDGITISVLGYKGWSSGTYIKSQIANDITNVKDAGADIVICTFHWGEESNYQPNNTQKALGRFAVDSGADLVVGHHPHVIQGIEIYQDKYIVYSLGNFCFGGNRNPSDKETFIFQQTFEFYTDSLTRADTNDKANIYPCSVSSVKERNDYRPTPLTGVNAERFLRKLTELSIPLNKEDITTRLAIAAQL